MKRAKTKGLRKGHQGVTGEGAGEREGNYSALPHSPSAGAEKAGGMKGPRKYRKGKK